jgi:hypothetical protein
MDLPGHVSRLHLPSLCTQAERIPSTSTSMLPQISQHCHENRRKQFSGNQYEFAKELNFALKTASKMVNSHSQIYIINETMHEELRFIRQALQEDSKISFEAPIALIIPIIPSASLFGDSSLTSCGGYSTDLRFWWFVPFQTR